jgi:hypothetical protein
MSCGASRPGPLRLLCAAVVLGLTIVVAVAVNVWAAGFDLTFAGLTLAVAHLLRSRRDSRFAADLAVVSLTIRWLVIAIIQLVLAAKGHKPLLTHDEFAYDRFAIEQSRAWLGTGPAVPQVDLYLRGPFSEALSAVYTIGGYTPLVGLSMSVAFGTWTPVLIHKIMADNISPDHPQRARIAGVLASIFPTTLIWSCLLLKDSSITFACTAVVAGVISLPRGNRISRSCWAALVVAAAAWLITERGAQLAAVGVGLVLWLVWTNRHRLTAVAISAVVVLAVVAGLFIVSPGLRTSLTDLPHTLAKHRILGREHARTAEAPEGPPDKATWLSTVLHIPQGLTLVLLRPLPTEVDDLAQLGGMIGNVVYLIFCGLAVAGSYIAWRGGYQREALLVIGVAVALWLILSVTEGNAGTAWRHRDAVTPLLACLVGFAGATSYVSSRVLALIPRPIRHRYGRNVAEDFSG